MRRVRNDDIGLGNFLHHARHRHLPLLLTNLALDLGIAFRLLHLILDFLLGHLEILRRLPFLIAVIHDRHDHDDPDDDECHPENDLCDEGKACRKIEEHELRHCKNLFVNKAVEKETDDEDLEKGFRQFHQRAL